MAERPYLVKLVRDRVGEYLGGDGAVEYKPIADRGLQIELLRDKLIEESIEYLKNPSIGEAADVLQAILDLAEVDLCVDRAQLEAARVEKYLDRGGFLEGVGMFVTTTAPEPPERERVLEVGDRCEILGGPHDHECGVFKGRAPKAHEDDEDGWLVQVDGRESPVWAKFLRMPIPRSPGG